MPAVDFAAPAGAAALFAPDSVNWRVMKNPVALTVGGIAAVILELAEPRVRTGVWEHTSFRTDPVRRVKRTGFAAMVGVYAPEDAARRMIAGVVRAHERVRGETPDGVPYHANDPDLLNWVHATATWGFLEAYRRFVRDLPAHDADAFYAEAAVPGVLFGADHAPCSVADMEQAFADMAPKLERSDIVFELLHILRDAPLLPSRALQRLMVRAAVDLLPAWVRERLSLGGAYGLRPGEAAVLRALGRTGDKIVLESAAPAQASVRLGLPADYLYR
jgi:uncharacterized protein (DUF2236 family)